MASHKQMLAGTCALMEVQLPIQEALEASKVPYKWSDNDLNLS